MLTHGVFFSETKPVQRHTCHMEEVCFYFCLPAKLAALHVLESSALFCSDPALLPVSLILVSILLGILQAYILTSQRQKKKSFSGSMHAQDGDKMVSSFPGILGE